MKIIFNHQEDWASAYEAFDGTMASCLGKNCSASCCHLRPANTPVHLGPKQYMTTMLESEYDFQLSRFGQFPDGVETELIDVGSEKEADVRCLVRNCLADDGGCRLKDRKPILCRMFPFSPSSFIPLEFRSCPQVKTIAENPEIRQQIIRVRQALGFGDNQEWLGQLSNILRILRMRGE